MRALVTGGAGFIGSHIVDRLIESGHTVLVVDNLSSGSADNLSPQADLSVLDLGSAALPKLVKSFKPDLITHCAAQASVIVSMERPELDANINILGGINLCKAAADSDCRRFIYINTGGALYGHPLCSPFDETHPIRPISAYGLSKWTMECYVRMLLPATMPATVLRLANIYGPRQDPDGEAGVISIFGKRMLRGEPVTIYGDGEQTRDFLFVGDVVRAHELALKSPRAVTVHISSGRALSVNDLFELMARETGYRLDPIYEPERNGEVKHVVLDNERASRLMAWEPEVSLEHGLPRTLEWLGNGG